MTDLVAPLPGAAWTPADNLHITLRFIGEATDERLEQFAKALARVRVESFILPVEGIGTFPSRGPAKVIWAGFGNAHPRLFQLRKQVDEALLSVEPGLDVSSFHPHATVARLGRDYDTKDLMKYLEQHRAFEAPPFRVTEFHLMTSDLSHSAAPTYRPVQAFPLGQ
jgi:2'-5' RNA ligase